MAVLQGSAKSVADGGFYPTEIAQSLRFNDDDSAYLLRSPSVASNTQTFTNSCWVKRGNLGTTQYIWSAGTLSYRRNALFFNSNDELVYNWLWWAGSAVASRTITTSQVFRDPSAWYHIVLMQDTTQSTGPEALKLYVNGVEVTAFSTDQRSDIVGRTDGGWNNANKHAIGISTYNIAGGPFNIYDGYIAEFHSCDGTAYTADDFGEFKSGVWVAKTPSVTYGTNGFYLDFADSGNIGNDANGSNNWTPTNLAATDQMLDSPTNNFATLNPLNYQKGGSGDVPVFTEGNLGFTQSSATGFYNIAVSTMAMNSGKWYAEYLMTGAELSLGMCSVSRDMRTSSNLPGLLTDDYAYFSWSGQKRSNGGSATAYGSTFANGDIIGIAFDADTGSITFYKNGVSQGVAFTGITQSLVFAVADAGNTLAPATLNFGQDSSFAGTKTPQGNTDDNGIGDFYYEPPTGYLALCTANLPEPAISPLNDASPSDYFNTVLYTGNGTSQSITGVGFAPDMVWAKGRNVAYNHWIYDQIRGGDAGLLPNLTNAENTTDGVLDSLDGDGFTLGSNAELNESTKTYVAWNWKANGTPVSNTDGTITSSVSANVDSGFSIVSYTATNSSSNFGHGLSQAPELIISKSRTSVASWAVYTTAVDGTYDYLALNSTAAKSDSGLSLPTASVVYVSHTEFAGTNVGTNNYVAYCFHSVEGFSKIGSYTGNGSATDGTFVYLGFRPSFVMIKSSTFTGTRWVMHDGVRSPENVTDQRLYANESLAEYGDDGFGIDTLSNGFKVRTSDGYWNASGQTYIYMAFAESGGPFKYSLAR